MQLLVTVRNIMEHAGAKLASLFRQAQDLRPALEEFGVHMIRSVQQTFDAGGRPVPWPPSIRVIKHGGKTLIKSARLKNSIVARVTGPREVRIGTNVIYAGVHQFGFSGVVQIPEHLRRVKSRDIYQQQERVSGRTGRRYTAKVKIATGFARVKAHPANMRIPARPFLVVQDEDMEIMRAILRRHVIGSREGGGAPA